MKFDKHAQRFLLIALCMFAVWSYGPPAFAQDDVPVVVAPAPATQPSDIVVDQPATPTTEVPSPAAPQHASESVMWALIASYVMKWLMNTTWFPLLSTTTSSQVKAIWGFAFAFLTAIGISVAVTGSIFDVGGASITFANISWQAFKDVAWQWAAQQGWFDLIVKRSGVPVNV